MVGLMATSMDDRDMIDVDGQTGDWDHDRRQFTRSEVIGIIRPRVEEILEEVHHKLQAARFDTLPSQRIVLTGGASQIPGMEGLASRILGQQVRLGRPLRVSVCRKRRQAQIMLPPLVWHYTQHIPKTSVGILKCQHSIWAQNPLNGRCNG